MKDIHHTENTTLRSLYGAVLAFYCCITHYLTKWFQTAPTYPIISVVTSLTGESSGQGLARLKSHQDAPELYALL